MTDKELDKIYDVADFLMKAGAWSIIDDLLEFYGTAAWRMDIDLLLAWATTTNVCRDKLKNRKVFMEQIMKFHPSEPGTWQGLYEDGTDPIAELKKLGFWKEPV